MEVELYQHEENYFLKRINHTKTKKNKITRYLDFQIIECANNDGIVLSKDTGELWGSHLGNYRDLDDAKKAAIIHLMIARPMHFSVQLYHRVCGTHTCHDYLNSQK